jgi:hypothetical protein
MAEAFEKLADGLPDDHKAEFFRVLHETGISRHDMALAKLLRTLQLYKVYYESIPDSVLKAVAEIEKHKTEIKELTSLAEQCADAGEKSFDRITQEAAQVNESLKSIHTHIEDAAGKASAAVSNRLTAAMEKTFSGLTEAGKVFSDTVASNKQQAAELLKEANKVFSDAAASGRQASEELRKNIKAIRWAHIIVYALAAVFTIMGAWAYIHSRYEIRLEDARAAIVSQNKDNHAVLMELSKSNRWLDITINDKGNKLLIMKNATGWTSFDKQGVIEFK